jgi:hypothetical protein
VQTVTGGIKYDFSDVELRVSNYKLSLETEIFNVAFDGHIIQSPTTTVG